LIVGNPLTDHVVHGGVESFDLAVRGRLICCGTKFVDFHKLAELLEQFTFEVGSPVGKNL